MTKHLKARVIATGKIIKVKETDKYGFYEDIKTGDQHVKYNLYLMQPKHMVQLGFRFWRFGLFVFAREYWKYKVWYLIPGVAVSAVNGYDRYVDIEAKILFIGLGIRFIWVKKK